MSTKSDAILIHRLLVKSPGLSRWEIARRTGIHDDNVMKPIIHLENKGYIFPKWDENKEHQLWYPRN